MPRRTTDVDILQREQIRATKALDLRSLGQTTEVQEAIDSIRRQQIKVIEDFRPRPKPRKKHTRKPSYSKAKKTSKNPKK